MEDRKPDRRVRYTRMAIKDSFVALLEQKPIAKISIKEICERADVNRATFYAHYQDQYDLLHQIVGEFVSEIKRTLGEGGAISPADVSVDILEKICQFVMQNAKLCLILLGRHADLSFQEEIIGLISEEYVSSLTVSRALSEEDAKAFFIFSASGAVSIIRQWLSGEMNRTAREMAELILRFTQKGESVFGS